MVEQRQPVVLEVLGDGLPVTEVGTLALRAPGRPSRRTFYVDALATAGLIDLSSEETHCVHEHAGQRSSVLETDAVSCG